MRPRSDYPTRETLERVLEYHADTGRFWYRESGDKVNAKRNGIRQVEIDGVKFPAHHLVWIMETGRSPTGRMRFRDGDKDNHRFKNLKMLASLDPREHGRHPSKSLLLTEFDYHPETGTFTKDGGGEVGTFLNGYRAIYFLSRYHYVHRMVWLAETGFPPSGKLRFKNGDIFDTRFSNLEEAHGYRKYTAEDVEAAERAKADLARLGIDASDIDAEALRLLG